MVFEYIYKEYWPKIFRLCMGYTNDHNLAEDMTQETFITVWQMLPTFRNESSIGTWIYRIATNNCLRQILELLKKINETESNQQYLKKLQALKEKQLFMQTTILNLYFLLLSTGISLYMYEYIVQMTVLLGVFSYGITGVWILFNWFYLRPKQIKKQQSKLNDIINKFENIQAQLNLE